MSYANIEQFKDILSLTDADLIVKYGKDNLAKIKECLLGWFAESNKATAAKCLQDVISRNKPECEIMQCTWGAEDVIEVWDNSYSDTEYTDADIQNVLSILDDKHDATIGINWDVIDCVIGMYIDDREN